MIKNSLNNTIKHLLIPALMAGLVSCNKAAKEVEVPQQDTLTSEMVLPDAHDAETDNDTFESVAYTIPYLGTADGSAIELNITQSTVTDTVYGNYLDKYSEWGELGHDLNGKVSDGIYNFTVNAYSSTPGTLMLKQNGTALTGTFKSGKGGNAQKINLSPAINIAANPQLKYGYRLTTAPPIAADDLPEGSDNYRILTAVEVYKGKELLQTLEFEREAISQDNVISLADYNFDGYLDLLVEVRYPMLAKGDWGTVFYLYNPQSGRFEKSEELNNFRVLNMYYGKKEILYGEADGSGNESNTAYKWFKDTLLKVNKVYIIEESPKTYHQEYTVQNGKSILTKEYTE